MVDVTGYQSGNHPFTEAFSDTDDKVDDMIDSMLNSLGLDEMSRLTVMDEYGEILYELAEKATNDYDLLNKVKAHGNNLFSNIMRC